MPRRCGWFGCGRRADKHVVFAIRVHDAASLAGEMRSADTSSNRFDLCEYHVAQIENNYVDVEVRDLPA
jgi:hypothetical protein